MIDQLPPLGLYIHLPWCERKCPYCDFNSHENDQPPESDYVDALLEDLRADAHLAQGRAVETLFIGGGTPSLFSSGAIGRLLAGTAELLELAPGLEATMEANPGSAEAARFSGFREAGINRLSLGVQSFCDRQLHALGRVHDGEQARAAVRMVRAAGFSNFNIDLMHGLPGQSVAGAAGDLAEALDWAPPHLSWYQLTLEQNTVFHKRPPTLPVDEVLADIQDRGEEMLSTAGYGQYEVSAYSRPGFQCRHNHNYWSFGDYLGIGAGAHGKITRPDGIYRFAKTRQPAAYMAAIERRSSWRQLDADELRGDYMLYALRLRQGFSRSHFTDRTGLPATSLEAGLERQCERGMLEWDGDIIRPTALGRRFLDTLISDFL